MAARLHFASAAEIRGIDAQAPERVRPGHDDVIGENRAELERERVERPAKLVRRDQQRRGETRVVPRRDARGAGSKIVG